MHVRAATMLPLKPEPEVGGTKNTNIEGIDELLDAMMEEPVRDGGVLLQGLAAAGAGVGVIWADEACKLWPLEVSSAVGKKDGWQTECVHHSNEATMLLEPVLPCSTQTGSVVQYSVGEDFSVTTDHVSELLHRELGIMWMLTNVDVTCM